MRSPAPDLQEAVPGIAGHVPLLDLVAFIANIVVVDTLKMDFIQRFFKYKKYMSVKKLVLLMRSGNKKSSWCEKRGYRLPFFLPQISLFIFAVYRIKSFLCFCCDSLGSGNWDGGHKTRSRRETGDTSDETGDTRETRNRKHDTQDATQQEGYTRLLAMTCQNSTQHGTGQASCATLNDPVTNSAQAPAKPAYGFPTTCTRSRLLQNARITRLLSPNYELKNKPLPIDAYKIHCFCFNE